MKKQLSKGFTLIELLVVIAVVGILAAAVMVGIDPVDKMNAANDSKVQNDISAIATAVITHSTGNNGAYSANTADLATSGDLKVVPVAPTGYSAYVYTATPASPQCTTAAKDCTAVTITGQLKSKKYTATPFQRYETSSGKTCQVATAATACP